MKEHQAKNGARHSPELKEIVTLAKAAKVFPKSQKDRARAGLDGIEILARTKVLPQLRKNWRRFLAKIAAEQGVKVHNELIRVMSKQDDKQFFIELGKCLSKQTRASRDDVDIYLAHILANNPSISEKDALALLEKLHPKYKNLNLAWFRKRKERLLAALRASETQLSKQGTKAL